MPAIEISKQHYDRLMAFKPFVEQITQQEMSESEYADFIAFWAVDRLLLESAMSGDLQVVEELRKGESASQAAINTLRNAQITIQGLSRHYPDEVFSFLLGVWQTMSTEDRQDKGMGLHIIWERYRQSTEEESKG
jgi:hypothetical protein